MHSARVVLVTHPRHLVLFGIVGGLLLGPRVPTAALLGAALGAGLAIRPARLGLACAGALLGGAVLADARLDSAAGGRLSGLMGQPLEARAVLLEPVRERAAGPAVARARLLDGPAAGEQVVVRARGDGSSPVWPPVGAEVDLSGRLEPLGRYDAYQARRGAKGAVVVAGLHATGRARGGIAGALDRIRMRAETGLQRGLPPPEAALMRGMVLGQDERLEPEVREDFERAGLAHLLAVSGQNVMLLAVLVLACGALVGLDRRARLLAALALIAIYVPLCGAGPSIQRAGVMGAAGLVAALAGRPASRWYAVGLAAAATLAWNPRAVEEPGWQLSFAAVIGLLALAPRLRDPLERRGCPGPLADATAMTVAATLATAPLLAHHFESVSLASLPANLAAFPAVAPLMWLGMLGAALAQLGAGLATPLNVLSGPLLAYLEWIAAVAAAAPWAAVPVRLGGGLSLVLAYGGGVAALAGTWAVWRRGSRWLAIATRGATPSRGALAAAVAGACTLLLAVVLYAGGGSAPPAPGELVVSFLDVGQGDATLLQRDGASVLVDTGPPDGPILRRLAEADVERLDLLVLTHAQADHEGAALKVVRAHRPRMLLNGGAGWPSPVQAGLAGAARTAGARRLDAHAGQRVEVAGMRFEHLWPPPPDAGFIPDGDPNERALVSHVRVGEFDLLLPADAESAVTAALALPRVEALKVAHHGSDDAGLPQLLARLRPDFAAIEVGRRNTYGHPTPSTLAALRAVPRVVRTDRDGTVRLRVKDGAMRVERAGGVR